MVAADRRKNPFVLGRRVEAEPGLVRCGIELREGRRDGLIEEREATTRRLERPLLPEVGSSRCRRRGGRGAGEAAQTRSPVPGTPTREAGAFPGSRPAHRTDRVRADRVRLPGRTTRRFRRTRRAASCAPSTGAARPPARGALSTRVVSARRAAGSATGFRARHHLGSRYAATLGSSGVAATDFVISHLPSIFSTFWSAPTTETTLPVLGSM